MLGSDAILRCLEAEGVDVAFGIPGGAILPTYDAIARGTSVRHVLARHEQGAGHMAEGYARASGKVGVAIATSGPGATNLVTAIADAWMDSTPLVCVTGQVRSNLIGSDAFQEVDITGITMPIVKHSWLVQDVQELPRVMKAAFHVARTGRQGPVLVDVAKDVQGGSRRPGCTTARSPRLRARSRRRGGRSSTPAAASSTATHATSCWRWSRPSTCRPW
jgi:acetolactate synthase-1/2/3 large subunit